MRLDGALVERGVEDRPEMDEPPEENKPKDGGEAKLHDGDEEPALEQLSQSRNEETAKRCNHVAGRTLSCHAEI